MLKKGVFWALHTRHLQNGTAPPPGFEYYVYCKYVWVIKQEQVFRIPHIPLYTALAGTKCGVNFTAAKCMKAIRRVKQYSMEIDIIHFKIV